MQKQQRVLPQNCLECSKKDKLIEKYLNLIELFKKKSERSILKKSLENGNSNISYSNLKIPKLSLLIVLFKLNFRRKAYLFQRLRHAASGVNYRHKYAFLRIIQSLFTKHAYANMKTLFERCNKNNPETNRKELNQSVRSEVLLKPQISCFILDQRLKCDKRDKLKQLTRKVFELTQELAQLRTNNNLLERKIEDNKRRQDLQSKKKQLSMQMLGEEMADKNEIIAQLQASLKTYESRQGKGDNNILDEDGQTWRRQIQQLEKINDKLNLELERKSQHLLKNQQQLRYLQGKVGQLELELIGVRERNFEMGVDLEDIERKKKYWNNMSLFLQKKLVHLKKYEKTICNNLRIIEQRSLSDNNSVNSSMKTRYSAYMTEEVAISEKNDEKDAPKDFNPITRFQNEYKIEKILNYLYNIELQDCWINNEERLFDNEQFSVLQDVKVKFTALSQQLQQLKIKKQKIDQLASAKDEPVVNANEAPARLSKLSDEGDQIYYNKQHVDGSIFDMFAGDKEHEEKIALIIPKIESEKQNCERCVRDQSREGNTRRSEPGFTIKLLEMELQKNKQVEKISELKNKIFHIRSIVMNFIKALETKNLKPEARDIMEIFFELFEYSQEEKEVIFKLKDGQKRFFGIF